MSNPELVTKILEMPPRLHDDEGDVVSWRLEPAALRYLDEIAEPAARTLEVGVGASTVLLAQRGCRHLAITPFQSEVGRLRAYVAACGLTLRTAEFLIGRSQDILPTLPQRQFDLALIDGDHAFPIPIVDWYFAAERLRVGGMLVVDDVQIWTGALLRSFLLEEPGWRLEWEQGRAFAFRKTADPVVRPWRKQSYIARRSLVWGGSGWIPALPAPDSQDSHAFAVTCRKHREVH